MSPVNRLLIGVFILITNIVLVFGVFLPFLISATSTISVMAGWVVMALELVFLVRFTPILYKLLMATIPKEDQSETNEGN